MYTLFKGVLLRVMRAPLDPPEPPAGSPASTDVFRASPRFLTAQLVVLGSAALVVLGPLLLGFVLAVAADKRAGASVLAIACTLTLLLFLLTYFMVRLDYDMRYYIVTDRSLRIRQGALVIQESTYTFANVQNLNIVQGPIDRLLGVASVRIETAGGGAASGKQQIGSFHHGVIAGIENAEEVRDRILELLRAYRDAGLGDEPARAGSKAFPELAGLRLVEIRDELRALRESLVSRP